MVTSTPEEMCVKDNQEVFDVSWSVRTKKIVIVFMILAASISNIVKMKDELKLCKSYVSSSSDYVRYCENKFEGLNDILPEWQYVTFVSDKNDRMSVSEYYSAQYVLSPTVLVNKTDFRPYVEVKNIPDSPVLIYNFHNSWNNLIAGIQLGDTNNKINNYEILSDLNEDITFLVDTISENENMIQIEGRVESKTNVSDQYKAYIILISDKRIYIYSPQILNNSNPESLSFCSSVNLDLLETGEYDLGVYLKNRFFSGYQISEKRIKHTEKK